MKSTYHPQKKKDGMFIDQILSGGHMLNDGKLQDIHEESELQNYDIGTRLVLDDRVFRYAHAGDTLKSMMGGLSQCDSVMVNTAATIYKAGTYKVTILDTTPRAADYYKGGYVWIMKFPHEPTGLGQLYRIKSSAYSAGTSVELTLWEALGFDVPASNWTETLVNIYSDVVPNIDKVKSLVVQNLMPITSGFYFWGQTWGPCFFQCGLDPGSKDDDREVYFVSASYGIKPGSEVVFTVGTPIPQRIGFLLNSNWVMLQLSP